MSSDIWRPLCLGLNELRNSEYHNDEKEHIKPGIHHRWVNQETDWSDVAWERTIKHEKGLLLITVSF